MYQKAIQTVKGSIFPIFHLSQSGFAVAGTGFFIDSQGHFLTASHVITTLPPGANLGYAGNIPYTKEANGEFLPIKIIKNEPALDLAIGHVMHGALPPLRLATSSALHGQSVVLCGYPLAMVRPQTIVNHAQQAMNVLDITHVRQYWQPTVLIDSLPGKGFMNKSFHSFLTQDASLNGMSGGPIFDLNGDVVGVASANLTRQIHRKNGIPLTIENGVGIDLVEIQAFLPKVLGPALVTTH